jgi:hypothetical protein
LTDPPVKHNPGNAAHGKELFETRGCLACHSIGEGDQMQGGTFRRQPDPRGRESQLRLPGALGAQRAAAHPSLLSVRKERHRPRRLREKGLPYVFDLQHSKCPNDGHELQVQNMTVMPSLRLTVEDASDIASYLITLKKKEPSSYADAAFMDDPALKDEGKKWIRHFGCAGCHEISGFEDEGRIGTELTFEGSKPIERLDFALFTEMAQRGDWRTDHQPGRPGASAGGTRERSVVFDHMGFFEHKLAEPNVWDQGKIKVGDGKAPHAQRAPDQGTIRDLTTFLMGSQESALPANYQYRPLDYRRDIQEGWWVVKKYNCMGCHQFIPGQQTALMGMKHYQEAQEQLPPKLLTEGARVDPAWLLRFLTNPGAERNRHESQRRASVSAGAHADVQLLGE